MWIKGMAGMAVLAIAAGLPASSQSAAGDASRASDLGIGATDRGRSAGPPEKVVREINDPHTGDEWILMRNPFRPEGPGRLVLVKGAGIRQASAGTGDEAHPDAPSQNRGPNPIAIQPVIHSGDVLVVEEHTAVVEARLEAVAVGPAARGAAFEARLKIGGKVVRVVAVSAGRAVFAPEEEAQP